MFPHRFRVSCIFDEIFRWSDVFQDDVSLGVLQWVQMVLDFDTNSVYHLENKTMTVGRLLYLHLTNSHIPIIDKLFRTETNEGPKLFKNQSMASLWNYKKKKT